MKILRDVLTESLTYDIWGTFQLMNSEIRKTYYLFSLKILISSRTVTESRVKQLNRIYNQNCLVSDRLVSFLVIYHCDREWANAVIIHYVDMSFPWKISLKQC